MVRAVVGTLVEVGRGKMTLDGLRKVIENTGDTIVVSVTGKPIVPRSENQVKLVQEYEKNDMLFAIGPAGSGKTYTAIALSLIHIY